MWLLSVLHVSGLSLLYLLISKLENKPDLQLQNFLEFDFLRKCEKSIANLWEYKTGETQNKEVRLGKSVLN